VRPPGSVTVRFIHINDVYDLTRFPALKTAVGELGTSRDADKVVITMGGDFLAPYLLSQLDEGAGMLDCMNSLQVTHCCFGNHECDVPHEALLRAIETFRGTWINSNMKGGGFGENEHLPTYDMFEALSQDGSHRRRIGMLGLLCDYPYLYREGAFNGAVPSIENVNESCARLCKELVDDQGCDVVVPMTHQNSQDDEVLAPRGRELRVPLILGGHDHSEICTAPLTPGHAALVKAGMDAVKVGVTDLTWDSPDTEWPKVQPNLLTTLDFLADPSMEEVVNKHMAKIWAMDLMVACRKPDMEAFVPPGTQLPLSSLDTRTGESSMATFLCTALAEAMSVDVALLEGGSVRAGTDRYHHQVTMSDLKAELPFQNDTVIVPLPGRVLSEAIRTSRVKAAEKGKYAFLLHCDRGCRVDPVTHCLTVVGHKPFDPDKVYTVAIGVDLGVGSGLNEPLMEWAAANGSEIPDFELAQPARQVLEMFFVRRLWEQLPSFDDMTDERGDNFLWPDEIESAYRSVFYHDQELDASQRMAVDGMVKHLIRCLNKAGDNKVSRAEYDALIHHGKPGETPRPTSKSSIRG